jgi:hypothetical protein
MSAFFDEDDAMSALSVADTQTQSELSTEAGDEVDAAAPIRNGPPPVRPGNRKRDRDGNVVPTGERGEGDCKKRFNEFSFVINCPDQVNEGDWMAMAEPFLIRTTLPPSGRRKVSTPRVEHYIWQWERGTTGRLHVQGVMRLLERQYMTSITNADPARQDRTIFDFRMSPKGPNGKAPYAHIDPIRTDYITACEYTEKTGLGGRVPGTELHEWGEMPAVTNNAGVRTDLADAMKDVHAGRSLEQMRQGHANVLARATPFINLVRTDYLKAKAMKCRAPVVTILWGPTGTGKTRRVMHEARCLYPDLGISSVYMVEPGKFFCGLDGQPVMLFDEACPDIFKACGLSLGLLLRRIDRYPQQLEVKNGTTWRTARHIYFTSNIHPDRWFPGAEPEHKLAFLRRVNNIIHMDVPWTPDGGWLDVIDDSDDDAPPPSQPTSQPPATMPRHGSIAPEPEADDDPINNMPAGQEWGHWQ